MSQVLDPADLLAELERAFQRGEEQGRAAEAELIARARQGDRTAFSVLYRRYVTPIYRYCWFHGGGTQEEAEDLASHVFMQAWQAINRYQDRGKPFLAWLHTIAHNTVVDHQRRSGRAVIDPLAPTLPAQENVAEAVQTQLDHEELQQAIAHLTPDQRQAIICQFMLGYNSQETGAVMGKRAGAVRALQMRALQSLRQMLGRESV